MRKFGDIPDFDAGPEEERKPREPASLEELLTKVVSSGGWDRLLEARAVAGTTLWQIITVPPAGALPGSFDVVMTVSEAQFLAGDLSRMTLRAECREYLIRAGLI
jgi:hypothetical protein